MYRIKSTGELKTQGEIRAMYPNTSLPAQWSDELVQNLGLDAIFESPQPTTTRYQTAYKNGVEQDANGKWVWAWHIAELDEEAKAAKDAEQAAAVRATRDQRLFESDWTQLADAPVDQVVWATYRQSLRNLSEQPGFPWDITWPVKP